MSAPDTHARSVPAVRVRGVRKVYGATVALESADLVVSPGEIHGLLGENGAGKSTLVRILAGLESADAGAVDFFGEPALELGARARTDCAFIHQDLGLFPTLSVAENIALGAGFRRRFGLISTRRTQRFAAAVLERLSLEVDVAEPVADLPIADQTAVAIAGALATGARLVVLDEPTAYLEAEQVRTLFELLERLRAEDVACVLITHRADDVLNHCDRITVLRNGTTVATRDTEGLTEAELVRLISGHVPGANAAGAKRGERRDTLLELRGARGSGFGPVDLRVGAGEVVGICGLADGGHFDVGRAMFGLTALTAGALWVRGVETSLDTPRGAIDAGLAYIPPDRRTSGLAEALTARENLFMGPVQSWFRPIRTRPERASARSLLTRFQVHPSEPDRELTAFSGGNQQKILLAKWLRAKPQILVLNDPTAGVDLAAKSEIHRQILTAVDDAATGAVLISSDFREVAELCDRVYVMRHGRLAAEVDGAQTNANQLVELAYGGLD